MIRNLLALTGLLAITLAAAIGLQAYGYFDDGDAPRRVKVSYAGLDLASPEGVRILEQRVNAAIDDVCRDHDGRELWRRSNLRECRQEAIAGVTPQIDYAVDNARRGRARVIATEDYAPPPAYTPPPPAPAYAPPADQPPLRLMKRTIVTSRTVTTTAPAPPAVVAPRPAWRPRPVVQAMPPRAATYRRLPEVAGSWLPPAAWYQINRAIYRSFQTGRITHWYVGSREGHVTVGAKRWVAGCVCRNVQSVKYSDGGRIVVAEGMKCLPRGG